MEDELYSWFVKQRERHVPLSYEILAEKSRLLFQKHYGKDTFVASRGWVLNFKKRHGLRHLKICGEKLSNDVSAVVPFIKKLSEIIQRKGLIPTQIYNADESGLFWKILPEKTLVHSKEMTAPGRKSSKERLTFLACANGDGSHKLKLLVIGKAKNPRAFKNATLPVEYTNSSNAWMTSQIFKEWFQHSFVKQVKLFLNNQNLPEKALLLIDNAPSHCKEDLVSENGEIFTVFLPPNCTALIQPMDQNAIRLTKLHYRKSLLAHILSLMDGQMEDVQKCIKSINIKDAVCLLHNSWEKVPTYCLKKCWDKVLSEHFRNESYEPEDLIPLGVLRRQLQQTRECYVNISNMLTIMDNEKPTEDQLFNWVEKTENILLRENIEEVSSNSEDEDLDLKEVPKIKHENAIKCLSVCLQWAEENKSQLQHILMLKQLKEEAVIKHSGSVLKQTKISNFFNKE